MTCKRIARLLSDQREHELSFPHRQALRLHLLWCVFCRRLARQLDMIDSLSQTLGAVPGVGDDPAFEVTLSPSAKSRLKKILTERIS
jgi:hypothetical protein